MEVIPYRENPPWPPKYNIKPDEKAKLTAADVVGPDGIVYPNWTRCGVTAYAGWEHSWDCLMDGIETFEYRHAPLFQWAASGCVIRNGHFHNSDGQWHSG